MLLETGNEQGKKHPYNKILCNLAERILRNIPLKEVCFLKKNTQKQEARNLNI